MLWRTKQTESPASRERRSTARLDKVFTVWLDGERGSAHGIARNISPGGLFVESPVSHPIGTEVRVNFSPTGGGLVAIGEVRYLCHLVGHRPSRPDVPVGVQGMGIRFVRFESESAPHESLH
jgi:hypothetical protein